MEKKINLFDSAVIACQRASASEEELKRKLVEVSELAETTSSNITVACNEAYQWFLSLPANKKHGAKKQLAVAAGVSDKTIGRYIAGGYVSVVTGEKVEAGSACNAINTYKINLSDIEKVKSMSDWLKLVKASKEVLKNGAGNNGKGKGTTPDTDTENTDTDNTPEAEDDTPFWVLCADKIAEEIASGEIDLMAVIDYISEIVADKKALLAV
jgi:hypothetical protein